MVPARFPKHHSSRHCILFNMTKSIALLVLLCAFGCVWSYGDYGEHAIDAAIISQGHTIKSIPYHGSGGNGKTTYVNIHGGVAPIKMHFSSRSSPVYLTDSHHNSGGSYHKSTSHDKPHIRVHQVTKPIVRELKEIVQPMSHTYQLVKPVYHKYKTQVYSGHHEHY